jgi:hypothetical protein
MSGFSEESHAGTVQTCALGVLLRAAGMQYWDLGMPMAYKAHLGATDVPRQRFLIILRAVRDARQCSLSTAPQPAAALLRPILKLNDRACNRPNLIGAIDFGQLNVGFALSEFGQGRLQGSQG